MLRFVILGLLRKYGRLHGYGLIKAYRRRSGGRVASGNFYRELRRLRGRGFVRGVAGSPGEDPRRSSYEITPAGQALFDKWLTARHVAHANGAAEDSVSARALFAPEIAPEVAADMLATIEENLAVRSQRVERARQAALTLPPPPARFDVLPLVLGRRLKHLAADLEFVNELRAAYTRAAAAEGKGHPMVLVPGGPPRPRAHEPEGH